MFHLFIEKNFESKGRKRERKRKKERSEKRKMGEIGDEKKDFLNTVYKIKSAGI